MNRVFLVLKMINTVEKRQIFVALVINGDIQYRKYWVRAKIDIFRRYYVKSRMTVLTENDDRKNA